MTIEQFRFRGRHSGVSLGAATARYAGWIGQIYTADHYAGRIVKRQHQVGGQHFVEEVLPLPSVEEYFEHFDTLEIDATFYHFLLDEQLHPTETFHLLRTYAQHLKDGDRMILKAPQAVTAPRLWQEGGFAANPDYLDAAPFARRFYAPAVKLLHGHLAGIVFEQEYRRAAERDWVEDEAADLERFFRRIPADRRYHLELRTESYLAPTVFDVLQRLGVGQVFSHWTWLPPLAEQFERAGRRFFNEGGEVLIRLMTPHGMRFEDSYAMAFPFDKLIEGMLSERMLDDAAAIVHEAVAQGRHVTVIVNNSAGGNAPLIAEELSKRLAGLLPGEL